MAGWNDSAVTHSLTSLAEHNNNFVGLAFFGTCVPSRLVCRKWNTGENETVLMNGTNLNIFGLMRV